MDFLNEITLDDNEIEKLLDGKTIRKDYIYRRLRSTITVKSNKGDVNIPCIALETHLITDGVYTYQIMKE